MAGMNSPTFLIELHLEHFKRSISRKHLRQRRVDSFWSWSVSEIELQS